MARERKPRKSEEGIPEPDMLPLMNIILMLILALITMAALLPLGFLSSQAQKLSKGGASSAKEEEEKKPLNLTIYLTEKGINLSVYGNVLMGELADPKDPKSKMPLIPSITNEKGETVFDLALLRKKLLEIKEKDKDELRMTITADEEIRFETVIDVMDTARHDDEKNLLFPQVSFAAGIVG